MPPPATKTYVLDTNTLIGFSLWIPISLNPIFWKTLTKALEEGKWILLDVVAGEVLYGRDIKAWLQDQKRKGLIKKLLDEDRQRATEINATYPMIDVVAQKSEVDTYLLAYAERNKLTVFSRESNKKDSESLYKIPDVCQALKIASIKSPHDFLKGIGYQEGVIS